MTEYTPNDEDMRWHYAVKRMDDGATRTHAEQEYTRWLSAHDARVRRDAQREAAQMIRDACDRWEVDGDDERLVNEVLDPWTSRALNPEETP